MAFRGCLAAVATDVRSVFGLALGFGGLGQAGFVTARIQPTGEQCVMGLEENS